MTLLRSLKKLFKSLRKYSKVLFTDKHFQHFNEKCKHISKLFAKSFKLKIKHSDKFQIEALYNRFVTLKAHINNIVQNADISIKKGPTAFKNRISTTLFINHHHKNIDKFFAANEAHVIRLLKKRLREFKCVKIVSILVAKFQIRERVDIKYIYSTTKLLTKSTNLHEFYKSEFFDEIKTNLENFEANGSDPKLLEIINVTLNVNKCNPLRAGSFMELPKFLKNRKALINPRNSDNYCFLWCLLKQFYPSHPFAKRISRNIGKKISEKAFSIFQQNFGALEKYVFPFPVKDVARFEDDKRISINIFTIGDKNNIYPIHVTKRKRKCHANLLILEKNGEYHYCLIQSLSRLLRVQLTQHRAQIFICERCLNYFYKKKKLINHSKLCRDVNKCAIILPSEEKKFLEFKNHKNQLFNPVVIYYDIECILKKVVDDEKEQRAYQKHEIFCIGLYVVNRWDEEKSFYKRFYGKNVAQKFMLELEKIAHMVEKVSFYSKKYIYFR